MDKWYKKNRRKAIRCAAIIKYLNAFQIQLFKSTEPCKDCGKLYPYECMTFDHIKGPKLFHLSSYPPFGAKKMQEEAEKCDLVCSNCHLIRTRKRSLSSGVSPWGRRRKKFGFSS
jgi:hypothetical protein